MGGGDGTLGGKDKCSKAIQRKFFLEVWLVCCLYALITRSEVEKEFSGQIRKNIEGFPPSTAVQSLDQLQRSSGHILFNQFPAVVGASGISGTLAFPVL